MTRLAVLRTALLALLLPVAAAAQNAPAAKPPVPAPAPKPAAPKPALAKGARLRGVVLKAEDGSPLPGADLSLIGMEQVTHSGADGRFDFGALEPGDYIVQARFLGFKPYTVRAQLADSSSLDLVFRLKLQPVQLEEQVVTAKRKVNRFTERMEENHGFGTFVTRAQIEERNTPFICDLLRGKLGVRVIAAGSGCNIRMSRAQGLSVQSGDCAPTLYLDGIRTDISLAETNSYPTTNLEGIEIYRSSSEAPSEFNAGNSCGVVAIWSRDGR